MGKFFISEFLEQALFWFTPMALSGTLRRGRRGCVPAPQRSRLAHARSWAPVSHGGCGGSGNAECPARGRSGPGPCSAPWPRWSPSAAPQHRPAPEGASSLTAQLFAPWSGPSLILCGAAADARPAGASSLVPFPRKSALFHNKTGFCFVRFWFFEYSCQYSALVASVAPQYPCSRESSKHASQ